MPESATDAVRRAVTRWDNQTTLLGADVMLATLECGHHIEHEVQPHEVIAAADDGLALPGYLGCVVCADIAAFASKPTHAAIPPEPEQ